MTGGWGTPTVWPEAVRAYCEAAGSSEILGPCYEALQRQIGWFEKYRKAEGPGFYYLDILKRRWESGVDEGVRFDYVQPRPYACVDATAHVFALYEIAAEWAEWLGKAEQRFHQKASELRNFIQNELFDPHTGFFYDSWAVKQPMNRPLSFEGMWPVVSGAAAPEQAARVIDEHLLNPERFCSTHPIATVALSDPHFELRCWRGSAWNSMTYWAARGCQHYGRPEAAVMLLELALDDSTRQFERTGTIWEFYHPLGGNPENLTRKPHQLYNTPCRAYLGHNPLIAMARLFERLQPEAKMVRMSG